MPRGSKPKDQEPEAPTPALPTAPVIKPQVESIPLPQVSVPQPIAAYSPQSIGPENQRPFSFDVIRGYLFDKVQSLRAAGKMAPDPFYTDVENVLVWLQTSSIKPLVDNYVRIMETTRFWKSWCEEQARAAQRERKQVEYSLDQQARAAIVQEGGKTTESNVEARVKSDKAVVSITSVEEAYEFLAVHLQNIIDSMKTEILVQSSVWQQREAGLVPERTVMPLPPAQTM